MKRFKGLSRSQFMVAVCNNAGSQTENADAEKENRPIQNTQSDEELNPSSILKDRVCENSNDILSEAIKHSFLFEDDLNIVNSCAENISLRNVDTDMSNSQKCGSAQDGLQSTFDIESYDIEKKKQALFGNCLTFQSQTEIETIAELQVCNSMSTDYEQRVESQIENKSAKPYLENTGPSLCPIPFNLDEFIVDNTDTNMDSDIGDTIIQNIEIPNAEVEEVVLSEKEEADRKKKRKRSKSFEQSNKRQANIDLRLKGQEYKGMVCKENGKYDEQIRPARVMKTRCNHSSTTPKRPKKTIKSKNYDSRTFLCAKIDEELRQTKFQEFWSIKSWDAKRAYLNGLVDTRKPYKRRSNVEQSRKSAAFDCYFHDRTGMKIRVCRQFFLNTLALGRDTFNRWLKAGLFTTDDALEKEPTSSKMQQNKQMRNSVIEWLEVIPKVPSHYCRASSSRVYVESIFQSKSNMHSVYVQWCTENNKKYTASRVTFSKILKDQKISIHKPRKDQCDTCYQFKVGNLSQEEYEDHRNKKEEGREAKAKEKSEISDKKLVITMDLQSVLLCPKLQVSKIYYSQKLQIHDFTIYSLNNGDVFLYVWHEGEGAVTSNEFVSCVSDFITKMSDRFEEIVLISDGCNYQNRNRVLTSQLSNLAVNKNIIIRQLILEKGHTMMEADSVHSTLENLFIPPICSPGDYVSRMRAARPKHPYTVLQVDHSFFQNYENQPNNFISIRPGRKVGDPTVGDIRALRYLPCGKVQFKLRHVDDWVDLPQRRPNKPSNKLEPLYKTPRKLKLEKFNALQELKSVIPVEYHPFYNSLLHE